MPHVGSSSARIAGALLSVVLFAGCDTGTRGDAASISEPRRPVCLESSTGIVGAAGHPFIREVVIRIDPNCTTIHGVQLHWFSRAGLSIPADQINSGMLNWGADGTVARLWAGAAPAPSSFPPYFPRPDGPVLETAPVSAPDELVIKIEWDLHEWASTAPYRRDDAAPSVGDSIYYSLEITHSGPDGSGVAHLFTPIETVRLEAGGTSTPCCSFGEQESAQGCSGSPPGRVYDCSCLGSRSPAWCVPDPCPGFPESLDELNGTFTYTVPDSLDDLPGDEAVLTMDVHIPPSYLAGGRPAPLLLSLHPTWVDGAPEFGDPADEEEGADHIDRWRRLSGFEEIADEEGFIVATPRGWPLQIFDEDGGVQIVEEVTVWDSGKDSFGRPEDEDPAPSRRRDAERLLHAIECLSDRLEIDESRIYAAGLSGGAGMANYLGCRHSDRFAAIAAVMGLFSTDVSCRSEPKIPVLTVLGRYDETKARPETAGLDYAERICADSKRWRAVAHCAEEIASQPLSKLDDFLRAGALCRAWRSCEGAAEVQLCETNTPHCWPRARGPSGQVINPDDCPAMVDEFDAPAYIWQFFDRFPAQARQRPSLDGILDGLIDRLWGRPEEQPMFCDQFSG